MFPRNENQNEGTFAKTTLYETALNLEDHQPYTATTEDQRDFEGGGVQIVRTFPGIALTMFIMAFVRVVRGLWGSMNCLLSKNKSSDLKSSVRLVNSGIDV